MSKSFAAAAAAQNIKNDSHTIDKQKTRAVRETKEMPLKDGWAFWFLQRQANSTGTNNNVVRALKSENYDSGLWQIGGPIKTAEAFWSVYGRLTRPVETRPNFSNQPGRSNQAANNQQHQTLMLFDVHFFRLGIKPVWEDSANSNGGKWIIRLRKNIGARLWEHLLLAMISGQLEGLGVCGAVFSPRFFEDLISIWNESSENIEIRDKLIDVLRSILSLPSNMAIDYKPHETARTKSSSEEHSKNVL